MEKIRKIKKVFKSKPTMEGAGVHLKRAFGFSEVPLFDPFLLFDDFRSDIPDHYIKGFPWHPHRGIETITYVIAGNVEHSDSLGNKGIISTGDVQWMTAGSGVIHQEMPKGDSSGRMHGFQLWANLPQEKKMMNPRYRGIMAANIPTITLSNGTTISIIAGESHNQRGPVSDVVIEPEYLDIMLPPHTEFIHSTKADNTVFAYIIEGEGYFCREKNPFTYEVEGSNYFDTMRNPYIENGTIVLFDEGENIEAFTEESQVRFLLISGTPLKEPIAWYGPIVMNSQDELEVAFNEYRAGTFIKHP